MNRDLKLINDWIQSHWLSGHVPDSIVEAADRLTFKAKPVKKVLALPGPRKPSTSAADRKVYAAVAKRDEECQVQRRHVMGECDGALEIDHQWGRGKEPTTEQNCRRMCHRHHQEMKHAGEPTRLDWLEDFRQWAFGMKFWGEVEKAEKAMILEQANHVFAARSGR